MARELRRFTRRQILIAALGLPAAYVASRHLLSNSSPTDDKSLVWVRQFDLDGEPNHIGRVLRDDGLGIILKTHDGTRWMSEFDTSAYAVTGHAQVKVLAGYFEDAGIPFHAWAALRGRDPVREAVLAADVLSAGARSLYVDFTADGALWEGDAKTIETFGSTLRDLAPNGRVVMVADARPWLADSALLHALEDYSNGIAVKALWTTYGRDDARAYARAGYVVPEEGFTPEFVMSTAARNLDWSRLPRTWIGDGAVSDKSFGDFSAMVYRAGEGPSMLWRHGAEAPVAAAGAVSPQRPAQDPQVQEYRVQSGDTISSIASVHAVSEEDIITANGLGDPNLIVEGQVLRIPSSALARGGTTGYTP